MRFKSPPTSVFLIILSALIEAATTATNQNSNSQATSNQNNPNLCQNVWKYPPNCKGNCTYQLVWRFRPADDSIEFIVTSKYAQRWTGVGFAEDRSLANSDFIFAWIEDNSRYVMMDAFLPTYNEPISDKHQSISNISASVINDRISFRFLRKRNTSDAQEDLAFADERCLYLLFPVEGGSVDFKNRAVITSEHQPHLSERPVCIRACDYKSPLSKLVSLTPGLVAWAENATSSTSKPLATSPSSTTRPPTSRPASTSSSTSRPTTTTTSTTSQRPSPTTTTSTSTTSTSTTTTTTSTTTTTTPAPSPPSTSTSTTTSTSPAPSSSPPSFTTQAASSSSTSAAPPTEASPKQVPSNAGASASGRDRAAEQPSGDQQWCAGRWSHPPNCHFQPSAPSEALAHLHRPVDSSTSIRPLPLDLSDCTYFAQWQYLEPSDSVEFIIQTKTRNKWTGIGFSNSTRMANSDAIIGLIDEISNRHFIMDTWLRDHVMPEIDLNQNTESTWGKRENGVTTVRFRRKRVTNDQFDFQFTDDSCAYFFFPTQGGNFHAISKRLHKHDVTPSVSRQRICIKSCSKPEVVAPSQTDSAPTGAGQSAPNEPAPATTEQAPPTSQPEVPDTSSSSQAPNLFLLSSSPASAPAGPTAAPQPVPPEKSLEGHSNVSLSPSNDLSAELDSASGGSSTSASSGHTSGSSPFSKLAFLAEPSLRWLAGIGCVATLLAMIVFQACFTVYKNKQAYKQNLYRQSAFKQNTYLHGAYLGDAHHQPSTGSEETQTASLRNSVSTSKHLSASQAAPPPPLSRSRAQQAAQQRQPGVGYTSHAQQPFLLGGRPVAVSASAHFDEFASPPATESSEQEEEEEEEEEVDEEDEEEFEDDMMMDNSFDYGHPQHAHGHPQHHRPFHGHAHSHRPHPAYHHSGQVHHSHHAHLHSNDSSPRHPNYQRSGGQHSHYRQAGGHHHPAALQHAGHPALANLHRAHAPSRSQPHQQLAHGNPNSRPDSYFLPSQRRY